jgi:hypothetical protein
MLTVLKGAYFFVVLLVPSILSQCKTDLVMKGSLKAPGFIMRSPCFITFRLQDKEIRGQNYPILYRESRSS